MWIYWGNCKEFKLTKSDIEAMSHQGPCDADVLEVSRLPYVKRQLAKISPEEIRRELKEYGAWNEEQLKDEEENIQRFLWTLAGSWEGQNQKG